MTKETYKYDLPGAPPTLMPRPTSVCTCSWAELETHTHTHAHTRIHYL